MYTEKDLDVHEWFLMISSRTVYSHPKGEPGLEALSADRWL